MHDDLRRRTIGVFDSGLGGLTVLRSPHARLPDEDSEARFVAEANQKQLLNLKGHRSVGGIRASLYNAMPMSGVEALASFMDSFR